MAVALFGAVDTTVSAIRCNGTQIGTLPGTVCIGTIARTQVTLLGSVLDAIATVIGQGAARSASSVVAVVPAVVTLLARVFETIAAFEVAASVTRVVGAAVVRAVVALFAAIELAVAAG